jgi:hypothetical protein
LCLYKALSLGGCLTPQAGLSMVMRLRRKILCLKETDPSDPSDLPPEHRNRDGCATF